MKRTEIKITAEPWVVAKGGRSVNAGVAGTGAKFRAEAGLGDEELQADMRLIAAAPRMYRALRKIIGSSRIEPLDPVVVAMAVEALDYAELGV